MLCKEHKSATPIVLSTGDYTVTATADTTQPLAFDSPCYDGSSSISINTEKASQCHHSPSQLRHQQI